jgi:hypothetical protein
MTYMGDRPFTGLTLAQTRVVSAAAQIRPQWAEGIWRAIYDQLDHGASSWTNRQIEGAIETALAMHGLAQTMPELIFMFDDVVPTLAGAGLLKISAQLGVQNARMLTAGAGVLTAAASMPDARIAAAFGGAGGLMAVAS